MNAIHVIGLSPDHALSDAARQALAQSHCVIGAPRHLQTVDSHSAENIDLPSPLSELENVLASRSSQIVCLLASGDPLCFGIGAWLKRNIRDREIIFHPAVSSIQTLFARLGLPWQEAELVSLHGRPLASLRARLQNHRWYAVLTDRHSQPPALARELCRHGFEDSTIWVGEDLGTEQEKIGRFSVSSLLDDGTDFSPLNVCIIQTAGSGGKLPEFPGIEDQLFHTGDEGRGGMLSKREVRINILSLLQPAASEIGWDVGAGCGGVAVEWARWSPLSQIYALEKDPRRYEWLNENRERFGVVKNLHTHLGEAPSELPALPQPDAIFIGGSGAKLAEILDYCWQQLKPGGRLVASAVTEESRATLHAFARHKQARWSAISVSRGESVGRQLIMRPLLPVTLVKLIKEAPQP